VSERSPTIGSIWMQAILTEALSRDVLSSVIAFWLLDVVVGGSESGRVSMLYSPPTKRELPTLRSFPIVTTRGAEAGPAPAGRFLP